MASALSATVCSCSSRSVLLTDRMASMSLTSARPISDSLVWRAAASVSVEDIVGFLSRRGGEAGQDEGADEAGGDLGVGQVVGGLDAVGDDQANHPLGGDGGGGRVEVAGQVGRAERGGHRQ